MVVLRKMHMRVTAILHPRRHFPEDRTITLPFPRMILRPQPRVIDEQLVCKGQRLEVLPAPAMRDDDAIPRDTPGPPIHHRRHGVIPLVRQEDVENWLHAENRAAVGQ